MIKTFKDKETRKIYNSEWVKKFPKKLHELAYVKLHILDSVTKREELLIPPGNKLEKLKGNRKNQWSIRINKQYIICFAWIDNNAENVEITDYH